MSETRGMRVELRAVSRSFAAHGSRPVVAVSGVSLVVEPGEFVAVRGRSGSGKTTLLSLASGLDRPTAGSVLIDGCDLAEIGRAERDGLLTATGFVFQTAPLIRRLPVWENVAYGLVPLGVPPRERRELALAALRWVELEALARRRPSQLSVGERQRVALARALLHRPRLLLADEPTSNLDLESGEIVAGLLTRAHRAGCTVLLSSHDSALSAGAQRVLTLRDGRLVEARAAPAPPA